MRFLLKLYPPFSSLLIMKVHNRLSFKMHFCNIAELVISWWTHIKGDLPCHLNKVLIVRLGPWTKVADIFILMMICKFVKCFFPSCLPKLYCLLLQSVLDNLLLQSVTRVVKQQAINVFPLYYDYDSIKINKRKNTNTCSNIKSPTYIKST